jgi:lipopolysaccharide O-acetyltransferase
MLKRIKKYLYHIIDARVRYLLDEKFSSNHNPYNINFEDASAIVGRANIISGGENIYIGSNSFIGKYAWLSAFDAYGNQSFHPTISIGNNVTIGNFSCITAIENISIGDGCLFSEYVYLSDHYHGHDAAEYISPSVQPLYTKGPVIIGENSFLGLRVCILPGVVLGKHCVVGSNSVVTRSFPDYSMVVGSPARLIKRYNMDKKEWVPV